VAVLLVEQAHSALVGEQVVAEQVMVTTLLLLRVQPIPGVGVAGVSRLAQVVLA
jgi:hypothetical protein